SLRQADTRDALAPQDNLYTLAIRSELGERLQVIGALCKSLVAPENPPAVLEAMADARCHIVSLTVTEKGYCYDPASRSLLLDHPDIVHDLAHPAAPRSALGYIVRALAIRMQKNLPPFTVLSCDNLPSNGITTRGLVLAFAEKVDAGLAGWIAQHGAFPNAMVDRIVPKTTDEDRARVAAAFGMQDAWPVMTEAFTQWVVEDKFAGPRPAWEKAGVTIVSDAQPYEHAKLRMLNGSHSSLAYLGILMGHTTVDQAMQDEQLPQFISDMMEQEIAPTLLRPGLDQYREELLQRFRNPALKHQLHQIAMDGSQKLPQRLLGTIRARLEAGLEIQRLCFAVAGWLRYLAGSTDAGDSYALSDPLAASLQAAARDAVDPVQALLKINAVFGSDLPADARFVTQIRLHYHQMAESGTAMALQELTAELDAMETPHAG
uniref:mannitol dehydrogenase family protein n=1 Tax=Undibacterium sp. TaxID=1914977 RepID=UPI00374DDDA9